MDQALMGAAMVGTGFSAMNDGLENSDPLQYAGGAMVGLGGISIAAGGAQAAAGAVANAAVYAGATGIAGGATGVAGAAGALATGTGVGALAIGAFGVGVWAGYEAGQVLTAPIAGAVTGTVMDWWYGN